MHKINPLEVVPVYLGDDFSPIPLKPGRKEPEGKWSEMTITLENYQNYFTGASNIGIVLGDASKGLVDVDCDISQAARIAAKVLPELPAFGRASSPHAHRIARCPNAGKTKQFVLTDEESGLLGLPEGSKHVVLEVRANGGYTMFPPSIHPSGECVEWHGAFDNIPTMDFDDLLKAAGVCAFLAIILIVYPQEAGCRNQICMALAGVLVRAGIPEEKVDDLVVFVARECGDEEADKRRYAVETKHKLDAGEGVTGLPTLCKLLGIEAMLSKMHLWLYGETLPQETIDYIANLNEKFFVVESEGGKCRVAYLENRSFEHDQKRDVLIVQSFEDFRNRYMHILVQAGMTQDGRPIMAPLGATWLKHPARRQYVRIEFMPGKEAPPEIYNLWQGFPYPAEKGKWCKMWRHIWVVLAKRNRAAFWYIIKWVAWAVQNPHRPAEVALVFRGGKGTGKGTFCRFIKNLFGQHGLQVYSSVHLTGRFNNHLRDCVLLFADEAIAPKDRDAESTLKGYLTEPTLPLEAKGRDIIQGPNHLHVLMASNAEWVVPATADERRFAVFDVSSEKIGDKSWFNDIDAEMRNGGASAFLYFLQNLPLKGWHPRNDIPQNDALMDQRIKSLQGAERLWFDWLSEGDADADLDMGRLRIETNHFAEKANISATAAGTFLKVMGCVQDRSRRPSGWFLPPLTEAREHWNRTMFKVEWDDQKHWLEVGPTPF